MGEDGVFWRDVRAGCVVCCEGAAVRENNWFREIPWEPVKGEMLTVRLPGFPENQVVVGGVTLVPVGAGRFFAGATRCCDRLCNGVHLASYSGH